MKPKLLNIAPGFSINATDYANQANAILGIREAGKTYTAMRAAEELLEAGIPIIVFDPVGVWKNLKIGVDGNKGYPIVVAGGEGSDIRLTKENAVDIVRAAMKENVSLVIDLYCRELIHKATWISIVQSTVELLMYENKDYGLRHIFLEEAAEFIPQRIQPQQTKVYASLESLARMGRNASLGMTIINQRAEEVNKAILEICEMSLIHKQVGKNSLLSIQKWFEARQLIDVKDIIKSLPLLSKGECWAVGITDQPQRIQVSKKKTFHPDPKKKDNSPVRPSKVDVGQFVDKLNNQLGKTKEPAPAKPVKQDSSLVDSLKSENLKLKAQLHEMETEILSLKKLALGRGSVLNKIASLVSDLTQTTGPAEISFHLPRIPAPAKTTKPVASKPVSAEDPKLDGAAKKIMSFLAQFPDRTFTIVQIAVATNYSSKGGGFKNGIYRLNSLGFILKTTNTIRVNPDALPAITETIGEIEPRQYGYETYKDNLDKAEREVFQVFINDPHATFNREEIAERTETRYSASGGGFKNAIYRLNSLQLICKESGSYKLNPELLELN